MIRCICMIAALGVLTSAWAQQVYRWTDEKGRVHITDTPPPPGAKSVQRSRTPSGAAGEAGESYALQAARKNAPVTLYSQPDCDACDRARKLLNARGVPFKEVSVLTEKHVEEMKQAGGGNTVPVLIVGGTVQQGFEEGTYHSMLDAGGYPKTGVLPPRTQAEPKPPAQAEAPKDKPAAAEPEPAASGPYAPGAGRQRQKK